MHEEEKCYTKFTTGMRSNIFVLNNIRIFTTSATALSRGTLERPRLVTVFVITTSATALSRGTLERPRLVTVFAIY